MGNQSTFSSVSDAYYHRSKTMSYFIARLNKNKKFNHIKFNHFWFTALISRFCVAAGWLCLRNCWLCLHKSGILGTWLIYLVINEKISTLMSGEVIRGRRYLELASLAYKMEGKIQNRMWLTVPQTDGSRSASFNLETNDLRNFGQRRVLTFRRTDCRISPVPARRKGTIELQSVEQKAGCRFYALLYNHETIK